MNIHFVGIGGIGVSALARHFVLEGNNVTGSDLSESEIIEDLEKLGVEVYDKHNESNLPTDVDRVIYSSAVPENNPELKKAKALGVKTESYPEALGQLTEKYFTITVSGTHGKSTTTSMAALMLEEAGLDPTVIVGTKLKEFNNSNYRKGDSKYLLIEADEWQGSLLNYDPNVAILLNLELEHLDYYKNLDQLVKTFQDYVDKIGERDSLILNNEDDNLRKLFTKGKISYFSKEDPEADKVKEVIKVPGIHNLENALAVYRLGKVLDLDPKSILTGLSRYKGSWRRFEEKEIEIKGRKYNAVLDYAHHPTELKATLQAALEKYPKKRIVAIFQPHQYQRSMHLKDDFVKVFEDTSINKLLVTDIYSVPGREEAWIKEEISSEKMVSETENYRVEYLPGDLDSISDSLIGRLQGDELIVIIGAGDIYKLESQLERL